MARGAVLALALSMLASSAGAAPDAASPTMGKPKHDGPGWLTWVGFVKNEGNARVFVRLSSPPKGSVGQARAGDDLVVTIPGYKLDNRNHGRPLDTRYFGTDVVRVAARPTKTGVELRVRFKKSATEGRVTMDQAPDGETLVNLDF